MEHEFAEILISGLQSLESEVPALVGSLPKVAPREEVGRFFLPLGRLVCLDLDILAGTEG